MRYEGATGASYRLTYGPGSTSQWIKEDVSSGQPLPGGIYACSLTAGTTHATAAIRSNGPTGAIVDVAVCLGAHAKRIGTHKDFAVCPRDESGAPLVGAPTANVVCSAVYPNAVGRHASISILHDGVPLGDVTTFTIDAPITLGYAERPYPAGLVPLQPGAYSCRLTVNGFPTVDKPFTVS